MSSQSLHFYFVPFYILLVGAASCDVIQGKEVTESMAASNSSEDTEEINSDNILPYQFEPSPSEDSSSEDDNSDDNIHNRLLDSSW